MTYPLQPTSTLSDPGVGYIHSGSTVTSSGSQIFSGYGSKEVSVIVNVTATPTGTSPTLQFTIQEVDPGDLTTVFGTTASTSVINATGIYTATLRATTGGTVKVSWTIGGSSPSFTGVYSTVTTKVGTPTAADGSVTVTLNNATTQTVAQGAAAALSGYWPVRVTDGTNTQPTGDAAARAVFQKLTDGTNTAAVKAASTAAVATDPAIVVAISPNNSITTSSASTSTNNAAAPSSSTQVGGSDGTNLQAVRVFDADSGGGTQYVLGTILRKSASGGSVEAGTSSDPLRIDPTGTTTQPVSGTVTANIGTTNGVALDATLTGGTARTKITDGTTNAAVKAASTAAVAADPALVVAVSPNNSIAITAATLPLPTGAATSANQTTLGSQTTKINDGTNTAAVTASSALKVDGSAVTQPVSGTITANIGTSGSLALDATLMGGTQKSIVRGGAKGSTTAADVTSIASGANHQALDVALWDASGNQLGLSASPVRTDPTGTTTQPVSGTVTANIGTSGSLALDATLTGGTARTKITDGTTNAAVKAASTAAVATDPALVVAVSPNNSVAITAASLPLPTGAATETTLSTRLADSTFTGRINTLGQKTSANSTPVVIASDQSAVTVTGTVTATNPSVSTTGTAVPSSATMVGGSDGTNLRAIKVSATGVVSVDGSAVTQPISAASLPLPTGAATSANQTTLGSQTTKINDGTNTAAVKAASTAAVATDPALVVAISPNNTVAVSGTVTANIGTSGSLALDATLTGGTQKAIVRGGAKGSTTAADVTSTAEGANNQALDVQIWHGGAAKDPTQIRALASGTDTVTIVPSGTQTVSGTVTANIGTSGSLALDATLTGGTARTKITDGTNNAAVKAASTAAVATDPAVVVAVSPNNSVAITAASLPLPTGAATAAKQPALGTAGTASTDVITVQGIASMVALKVDGSAVTQPVSGTITANIGTSGSLALDATLTGGTAKSIMRGGAKGSTTAADVTSTASGANHQGVDVIIYDTSGNAITSFGGGTQFADGAARGTATGTLMMVDDGTNIQSASGDSTGKLNVNAIQSTAAALSGAWPVKVTDGTNSMPTGDAVGRSLFTKTTDGTNTAAVKAASTAAVATDPALVVAVSPNNTVAVSGTVTANIGTVGTLATAANQTTLDSQTTKINDGTNTAAVKAASTAAVATDPALVVAISPNNPITTAPSTSATSTLSNVAGSASSVTLLASNASRKGATIYNDSTSVLYVKFGTTASNTSFTVRMIANAYYEVPFSHTGRIDGIWASATGNARVTEFT